MFGLIRNIIVVLVCLLTQMAYAGQEEVQQIVQNAIETTLADIRQNKEIYQQDKDTFYKELNNKLSDVVDIEGITKSILTVKYINQATDAQIIKFQESFKHSLLKFYGDALLNIGDVEIRYLSSKASEKDPNRVSVNTEAKTANGTIYPINYTMVKVADKWMLRNVIVSGINIGKLFREQFADQMKKNKNNLDLVIDNWEKIFIEQQQKEQSESAIQSEEVN